MRHKHFLTYLLMLFSSAILLAQTKVSGYVFDEFNEPVPFANILFKGSTEGTTSNENGRFYLESDNTYNTLVISFIGFDTQELPLTKKVNYDLKITLTAGGEQLKEVVVYSGKQSKKNNPAIDILRKIWKRKRQNGLRQFNQYQYNKYEKVEFDLNTIDSSVIKSKLFKGMEFVFQQVDTSRITGKTYLPIFINEAASEVYGDNTINKEKENLIGNKNSGFSNNQVIIGFIKDLYNEYNVYDNYIKIFDKSFTSPISRTGIDTYNYVLTDSAFVDNKWCYNITYYPRRKNELTFKGDFWVNDTTYAIKEINMQASKSANINWVKELYIEQEFDVLNDSVFLIKRDYILSDFVLNKKEKSRGVYGKRTTLFNKYKFDVKKPRKFYEAQIDPYNETVYNRDDAFWETNRLEELNKDERGVYKMLDTLKTVRKFKNLYNIGSVLASGYIEFDKLNFDYGPIFSTFGFNDVEGIRVRGGGRTYFGPNDPWRIEGFGAYGFRDDKFKYGLSGKWLLDRKTRLTISVGTRRDVEQTALNLTPTTDVLGRSFGSSSLFASGDNSRLTNINLTRAQIDFEPWKNFQVQFGGSFRKLKSASPSTFSLDYIDSSEPSGISSEINQGELTASLTYTPGRVNIGYGVERRISDDDYPTVFINYAKGDRSLLDSDFDYERLQLFYRQPLLVGGFGRSWFTLEAGKTFGDVPLGLLSVIPGNQSYFSVFNTFPTLNFYEFITDTYTTVHLEHNFNGRLFSRIPFLRKLNLREIVGIRGAWGSISDANIALNQPAFSTLGLNPNSIAPNDKIYWEYSVGVGNIFKLLRIDVNFRGNYFDNIDARRVSVTGGIGFYF
ncbi:DUF5686 and carboxypeptidase-like regulatory domain-containing protein [Spongiivirga citrea]|uniref:Carboxypeptidase-like regulatory domain-containing protein n=1 Tax=Spongiivirga citrea TaxID=1481457 RepID=A0A6M0CYM6_9FLAO|nr:DUF5686 and carboxypeptidase-like regulatory domain-containing protein [Spongiivirga citrea]NER18840.1 carboxypeptidase-like regulatory domain-containing protein [Spongiivirga citrea]